MIDFEQVSKSYGEQDVLLDASFRINEGERVGIVGPNGTGKSTVFAILCGTVSPDKGSVRLSGGTRIGHLRQQFNAHEVTATLLEYAESGRPELDDIESEIHGLEAALHSDESANKEKALKRLGGLQSEFEAAGGYDARARAEAALFGLGFQAEDMKRQFSEFSGGWQMRGELARVLVSDPDVVLLDEPTNYLDIPAIEWLQKYMRGFKSTMLLISHDRYLLNSLTSVTVEIANAVATKYPGNYDYYVRERALRQEQTVNAQKNQDREIKRAEQFITRFRAKSTKAALVKSKMKQLERMEKIVGPRVVTSPGRIRLKKPQRSGQEVIRLDDAGLNYDGSTWVLRNVDLRVERGDKIAVIGPNGMGKSTLLRILAGKLPPTEGKCVLGHKALPGYQSQEFTETMDPTSTAFETVRSAGLASSEQEIRSLLGGFGFTGGSVDKRVSILSGGEKVRLAFARILIDPPNFLVLDEPTTHLDMAARESLEEALSEFDGTVCMVSHDIEFVRKVATSVIAMDPSGLEVYCGGYDYYCEKIAGIEPSGGSAPAQKKANKKADRRARAEAVQKRAVIRRKIGKRVSAAETRIEQLEVERAEILGKIESSGPGINYEVINKTLAEIQQDIDAQTALWEEAATEIEELELDI